MKNIEIFIGSPRRKGNTAVMARMLEQQLAPEDFSTAVNFLYGADIKPCTDCRACLKGEQACVIPDGMGRIYPVLDKAGVIVIGTPVYWFGPSAATKLLIDRLRPYYRNRKLEGKVMALLVPAADGAGDCDLTIEMMRRTAALLGMRFAGAVTARAFEAGEVAGDEQVRMDAGRLARDLNY